MEQQTPVPPPPWAYGPPSQPVAPLARHSGVLILLLGIGGLVVFPLLAPIAWILANRDLRQMAAGRMDPSGYSMTQAGRVLGMIVTILMLLFLAAVVVIMGGIWMMAAISELRG